MPKQTKIQQIAVQTSTSPSNAIMNDNEEFNIEAAKPCVLAREAAVERESEELL